MVEKSRRNDVPDFPQPTKDAGVNVGRPIDDKEAGQILQIQEKQTSAAASIYLEPLAIGDSYVDGNHLKNPDERDQRQIDALPGSLKVWKERLARALDALNDEPPSQVLLEEQQASYAKASKNLAKYMKGYQKEELMKMSEKATDVLFQRQIATGDIDGAVRTLGIKLDVDKNLTANAPPPHNHMIKDLQTMVELSQKYKRSDAWYWEDKLQQEKVN